MGYRILEGDVTEMLKTLPDESVQCCITSPPYWGLRDYRVKGQMGLEKTPRSFVRKLVLVFREVRRVLRKDGTLWLNLGDSYSATRSYQVADNKNKTVGPSRHAARSRPAAGLKEKDLVGIPWMVAFALRADGWYLRQDMIWSKPNPMPESVRDRCTKAHEYLFLLTKSQRYYYDQEAIKEPCAESSMERLAQDVENQLGSDRVPGKTNGRMKAVGGRLTGEAYAPPGQVPRANARGGRAAGNKRHKAVENYERTSTEEGSERYRTTAGLMKIAEVAYAMRNKRSVWEITTQPFPEAHFATFPEKLVEPCVLAGSGEGHTVLDVFAGSGTTGVVALRHGREFIGIELNAEYAVMARRRIENDAPLFNREQPGGGLAGSESPVPTCEGPGAPSTQFAPSSIAPSSIAPSSIAPGAEDDRFFADSLETS